MTERAALIARLDQSLFWADLKRYFRTRAGDVTVRPDEVDLIIQALDALRESAVPPADTQLRGRVELVIGCAERDCIVNPQFAGGLQPVIELLKDALAAAVAVPPAESPGEGPKSSTMAVQDDLAALLELLRQGLIHVETAPVCPDCLSRGEGHASYCDIPAWSASVSAALAKPPAVPVDLDALARETWDTAEETYFKDEDSDSREAWQRNKRAAVAIIRRALAVARGDA
jgi:hypothetical protein